MGTFSKYMCHLDMVQLPASFQRRISLLVCVFALLDTTYVTNAAQKWRVN